MLVVHGSWLPEQDGAGGAFVLWAEAAGARGRPRGTPQGRATAAAAGRVRRHPFAARRAQLLEALAGALEAEAGSPEAPAGAARAGVAEAGPASGRGPDAAAVSAGAPAEVVVRLPSTARGPLPSPGLATADEPAHEPRALAAWRVEAVAYAPARAAELLMGLAASDGRADMALGTDVRYWAAAARRALALLYGQRLLPALDQQGARYVARWRALLDAPADRERLAALVAAMPPACRAIALSADAAEPEPEGLLRHFLDAVTDAVARAALEAAAPTNGHAARPRAPRRPSVGDAWLAALAGDPVLTGKPDDLAAFYAQYRAWSAPVAATASGEPFRLCLRLDPPEPSAADGVVVPKASARDWTLEYLLQANDDPSLLVPAGAVWRERGSTARFLSRRLEQPQERLLGWLGQASRLYPPIDASLRTATPTAARLNVAEAHEFVREKALLLRASGFGVLVPGLDTRLGVRVRLGGGRAAPGKTSTKAGFSQQTLVEYDWQLALGNEPLSREELRALARLKQPLVQVRGRWVELRPEQLQQALAYFEKHGRGGQMPLLDAVGLALAPDGEAGLPIVGVSTDGWIDTVLRDLQAGEERVALAEPPGFVGALRPYQQVGVGWLAALRRYGLGACLADDMGLGKTVMLIALLLHTRDEGAATPPALLICPTSVVGNWQRELARFAPGLRVLVHHGAGRDTAQLAALAAEHDVVLSTYALLHRDQDALTAVEWDAVILDEAQNVKNAATRAAQAARALPARWRAALTGTPVENRLADLWSIFQFLNPGYLGSAEQFRKRFAAPIERGGDPAAAARLRRLVGPFILRRLKTDRAIIQDLPEKNEMKVYCTLTREQATLYEAIVQTLLEEADESEGIQRRGQILAALTKLKQVCDHPALLLHDASALAGRSGKLARLTEMLEEVLAVGDRALIFTQYAEMGKLLQEHLQATFGRETLFLHGGTPAAARDRMVARFQSEGAGPPLFLLSLKAGGTGLTLTRANHVFHFDRWWNPAVEDQATDRAFRIGQRRNVQVHKLLCAGTFEETLDQLIERKTALAQSIVGTSEAWITELSTAELRDLFALRREAVGDE
ncbi:MAG TPA: DEAD/DEAH box helicase [Chloroflexota bacterium]|nr:DEAD/DEAH box helicase [Chloroflexota bacterium]